MSKSEFVYVMYRDRARKLWQVLKEHAGNQPAAQGAFRRAEDEEAGSWSM
jgi:hypothetical protein